MPTPDALQIRGSLRLFGHEETEVELALVPRSVGWRAARAVPMAVVGLGIAAPAVLVPPHGAWSLAFGATGLILATRKWGEHFTLMRLNGPCPRCEKEIRVDGPVRFKNGATLTCEACKHEPVLSVAAEVLAV